MNCIPTNIEGMGGIAQEGFGGFIGDGGSAFISTEGWSGTRDGIRD